jgi:hypothetical protein
VSGLRNGIDERMCDAFDMGFPSSDGTGRKGITGETAQTGVIGRVRFEHIGADETAQDGALEERGCSCVVHVFEEAGILEALHDINGTGNQIDWCT